jgi:hypothetical protein
MQTLAAPPDPHPNADRWLDAMFTAKAVDRGGVLRRNVDWVQAEVGEDRLRQEVMRRGFRLLRSGPQYIVVCNTAPIQLIA